MATTPLEAAPGGPPRVDPTVSIVVLGWQNAPLLMRCLESINAIPTAISFEVIVTLNEPAMSLITSLSAAPLDIRVISSRVNRGFGGACNAAVRETRGDYVAFLNDDALVDRLWLQELVHTMQGHPEIGAVGSMFLNLDGSVQEAGSFLWSNGATSAATGSGHGFSHRYDWARRVDYCSAASLLVRRSTWDRVGGFDERYFPAYCEDVDLCLKIRDIGQEVWFQPLSTVRHIRSASTSSGYRDFLMERNRRLLAQRWSHLLEERTDWPDDPVSDEETAAWLCMGMPDRILVIDDRIPEMSLGSGYGRMLDAVTQLATSADRFVSFFPSATTEGSRRELARLGVRILHGDLGDHLRQPGTSYDVVVISRPHNYGRFGALVRSAQPHAMVIYDAEALYYRRTELEAELTGDPSVKESLRAEAVEGRVAEERYFADADHAVCISEDEAAFARAIPGVGEVHVIPAQLLGPRTTERSFEERRDIIFVAGWLAGANSPNGDGFLWLVDEVLPLLCERLPWARIRVTGASPPEELLRFESPHVHFEGRVDDLDDFYDRARVAISPVRYGAGVKIKTIEALQYGVPTVTTTVGAEGIDTQGTGALCIADDPEVFADWVARLADDPLVWADQRQRIKDLQTRWSHGVAGTSWHAVVDRSLQERFGGGPDA